MIAKARRTFVLVVLISLGSSVLFGATPEIVARAPNGSGLLGRLEGKRILIVSGAPEEMGTAHGELLKDEVKLTMQRVVYLVGAASTVESGKWFFDEMAEIERRKIGRAHV